MYKTKTLIIIELISFMLIVLSSCGRNNNEDDKRIKQKDINSCLNNKSQKKQLIAAKLKHLELPEDVIKKLKSKNLSFDEKNKVLLTFNRTNTNKLLTEKCFKLLYEQANTIKERHDVLLDLGVNYAHFKQFDDAVSTINKVIEELRSETEQDNYSLVKAYRLLALVNMSAGDFEIQLKNASEAYNYALKTAHKGIIYAAEFELSMALANNGYFDEAMEIINRMLKEKPNYDFLKSLRKKVLYFKEKHDKNKKINIMNMSL